MTLTRFATFAWGVLAYALVVILWGVVVRATGSGAGCGSHWPDCNGQILPALDELKTLIEFSHRLTSMAFGLLAIALVVGAHRVHPQGSPVRGAAWAGLLLTLVEGGIGRQLVVLELVADNASTARAAWMAGHLLNTFLLVAAFTLAAWWASGGAAPRLRGQGAVLPWLVGGLLGILLLGMSGAVTALGDTLFPASSLAEGLRQDLSSTSHFLIQLRTLHPLLAIGVGIYLMVAARVVRSLRPSPWTERLARAVGVTFALQLVVGTLNVALLAPVWMQLIHLLLADLLWIVLVLLTTTALALAPAPAPQPAPALVPMAD